MISRAAYGPRICLSCRFSLALRRRGVIGIARPSFATNRRQYASDNFAVQDKDRVESLIRGDGLKKKKKPETTGSDRDTTQAKTESVNKSDLPAWSFKPSKESAKADIRSDSLEKNEDDPKASDAYGESQSPEDVNSATSSAEGPSESTNIFTLDGGKVKERGNTDVKKKEFKHPLLRQHHLNIGALGHEVNALVLNNPDNLSTKKKKPTILPPLQTTSLSDDLDWKSLIPDQVDEADFPNEVANNIEQVRPADGSIVRKKDFLRRMEYLVDGFTKGQLALYFSEKYEAGLRSVKESRTYPWLISESEWTPSETIDLGPKAPKQRLAHHILKDIWGVEIQEEVEGLGYAAITLRPDIFSMIAETSTGALDSLKTDLLDQSNDEDIIPSEKEGKLQVYTQKASISTILSRIDEMVQSLKSTTISVEGFPRHDLQRDVLDSLARVTKTSLQYHKQTNKLDILWLGQGNTVATIEASTPIENSADIVLRLLRNRQTQQSLNFATHSQILLPQDSQSSLTSRGMLMPHDRETRSLSWRDKLRSWTRYVLPIGKPSEIEQSNTLGLAEQVTIPESKKHTSKSAEIELSASFGHILHSTPGPVMPKKGVSHRRVLLPVLPHPAAFTEIAGEEESPFIKTTSIILNFIPTDPTAKAPEVRLSLPVSSDDDFSNFTMSSESKLFAVSPLHENDILYPGESVDVRLSQRRTLPLSIDSQKPLQDFFASSEFNLVKGRLRTPSHTQFALPSSWLSKSSTSESTDLPYTFAGLEIHQTIDLEWNDHILRYNSIEAGQHGGTRQELSLEAKVGSDAATGTKNERNAKFLQLVEEVVKGTHFSWTEGFKSIREIPEDFEYELEGEEEVIDEEEVDVNSDDAASTDVERSDYEITQAKYQVAIKQSQVALKAARILYKEVRYNLQKFDRPTKFFIAIDQTQTALKAGRRLSREFQSILTELGVRDDSRYKMRKAIKQSKDVLFRGDMLSDNARYILYKHGPKSIEATFALNDGNMLLRKGEGLAGWARKSIKRISSIDYQRHSPR